MLVGLFISGCSSSNVASDKTQVLKPGTIVQLEDGSMVLEHEPPHLVGGLKGLQKTMSSLSADFGHCRSKGRVELQFMIDTTGKITEVEVIKGLSAICDQIAIRGIIASTFLPGKRYGQVIPVKMSLPITFR